jgi:outer membrane protein assembly factor BamB
MKPNLLAIRTDGRGDVTSSHIAWKQDKQIPDQPSPVLAEGRIYVISSQGVASCFSTATGDLIWRERLAGNYSASPLCAGGRIYFSSQDGKTHVVRAAAEFEKLAENQLDGQLMASPAVAGRALVLRTDTHLYRIEAK